MYRILIFIGFMGDDSALFTRFDCKNKRIYRAKILGHTSHPISSPVTS